MKTVKSNHDRKKTYPDRTSMDFFKDMLDNVAFGGMFVDTNRKIKYCNQNIEKIFGYSPPEIIGKQTDLLYGDRRNDPSKKNEIYHSLETNGFHTGTARGRTKDEKEIDLMLSTFLVKPNRGAVIFIEEPRKLPKAQIDRALFLQNLLDNIPDMIYFKDRHNRFILVNKAHADALNLSPEMVLGKSDLDLFPKKLAQKYYVDDTRVMETGKPVIGKIEKAARPDGGITYVSTTKVPHYDASGKIIGTIGITRNITDRMIAEEELRNYRTHLEELVKYRTQKLEENNERLLRMYNIKSEFTSMVSHELRTPLAIIKEGVALLEDETLGRLNENQKHSLDAVSRTINRLTRLINDTLDFSKLENKKMKFKIRKGNLNEVIDQVLKSYSASMDRKGLKLNVRLDASLPLVRFDPDRIVQILCNLITNAMKFTDSGSVSVVSRSCGKNVQVSVKDTGCGMQKEDLPVIFNKFKQLSSSISSGTSRNIGGTGLGLAICKQIIEQLGGRIFVESEYGKGSTFHFTLPLRSE